MRVVDFVLLRVVWIFDFMCELAWVRVVIPFKLEDDLRFIIPSRNVHVEIASAVAIVDRLRGSW